jgi:hypothetical protein
MTVSFVNVRYITTKSKMKQDTYTEPPQLNQQGIQNDQLNNGNDTVLRASPKHGFDDVSYYIFLRPFQSRL